MESNINERVLIFLNSLNTSFRQVEIILGFSNGSLGKIKKGVSIGSDKLEKIAGHYNQLNPSWILRNEGKMLLSELPEEKKEKISNTGYYNKLQEEVEQLKNDKTISDDQLIQQQQQIIQLWKKIDELKSSKI